MREEGVKTVLANSNPATIMTDTEIADAVYIEPLNVEYIEKIIIQDRPDAILAGMGGQTGLNLAVELYKKGILDKYNVRVIGTSIESIMQEKTGTVSENLWKISESRLSKAVL
jgi:carbamoyl-phosphate synthase large subunit